MQRGFSLIEVMVALLLLGICMTGMDAMQIISFKKTKINYYLALAYQQITNANEQLRAGYHVNEILSHWNTQNKTLLPDGKGKITRKGNLHEIIIAWGGYHPDDCTKNKVGIKGCLHVEI